MVKRLRSVTVRGERYEWGLDTWADDAAVEDWRADGLEVITPEYVIPAWVVASGLAPLWAFFTDVWNLRNPWRR